MTISRRDTILIAVLVNAGILAILLMTARYGDEPKSTQAPTETVAEAEPITGELISTDSLGINNNSEIPTFEIKEIGNEYAPSSPSASDSIGNLAPNIPQPQEVIKPSTLASEDKPYVEVTVKKGDSLDKIARANGTTIEEIKKLNKLTSDRLDVGKTLKIPLSKGKNTALNEDAPIGVQKKKITNDKDAVYYTVKAGDNPWKIARQYNVKYEDILRLNNMTEESARNMKVGDRVRVK